MYIYLNKIWPLNMRLSGIYKKSRSHVKKPEWIIFQTCSPDTVHGGPNMTNFHAFALTFSIAVQIPQTVQESQL